EFGHFAQSSTRVGQRAHRAMVVLRALVVGRDRFDDRLSRLRLSPNRIVAFTATAVTQGIGALRRFLAAILNVLNQLGLALAREMEFNADLHAVRLCGSDAPIEALWEAQRGALALEDARAGLAELAKHRLYSDDLFAHQRDSLARLDGHLDLRLAEGSDPMLLALRNSYVPGPALHFPPGDAPTEVMWYSHPTYNERERNAKRCYLSGDNQRWPSAWSLFSQPERLRSRVTQLAYAELGHRVAQTQMRSATELADRIVDEYDEREQAEHYHGFYDNRVVEPGDLDALLAELEAGGDCEERLRELEGRRAAWDSAGLARFMAHWREVEAQLDRLGAIAGRTGELPEEFELQGQR
ncbi:MAG: M48 family metalloprotease, partial [Myxococcales bacterium]|nr:M48 family metalloprotease [Myxococcales bacterium]